MLIRGIFPRWREIIKITHCSKLFQPCDPDKAVLKQKVTVLKKPVILPLAFNLKCQ